MANPNWHEICELSDLEVDWGEVALVNGEQYAIFKTPGDRVFATDHRDPNSGSLVIARGIVGSKAGTPTIASPLYKEVYNLETGEQLNGSDYKLPTYPVKVEEGKIYLGL